MTAAPIKIRASSLITPDGVMMVLTLVDLEGRFVGRLEFPSSHVGDMVLGLAEASGKLTTRCDYDYR